MARRRKAFLSATVAVQSLSPPRRFRLCGEYCTPNFMIFVWRWLTLYLVLLLTNPKARSGQCEKIQFFLFKYLDCVAFGKARRGRLFRTGLTLALAELPDPVGQQNCPLLSTVPSYSPAQGYGQVNESDMVY